jgi:hypothetical protein
MPSQAVRGGCTGATLAAERLGHRGRRIARGVVRGPGKFDEGRAFGSVSSSAAEAPISAVATMGRRASRSASIVGRIPCAVARWNTLRQFSWK